MASCPASTPRLKPTSASASAPFGNPRSASTLAKPKPWISPKPKATVQRRPVNSGKTLFSAASTTDAAIVASTAREGSDTMPSVASVSVIECASVKAVTMRSTSHSACAAPDTGCQSAARPQAGPRRSPGACCHTSTAGSSNDNRNRMWSKPIQMCHTPSRA